jgi:threonyl-tRNA synthetase
MKKIMNKPQKKSTNMKNKPVSMKKVIISKPQKASPIKTEVKKITPSNPSSSSGFDLVKKSNAKDIIAISIDGSLKDLSFLVPSDISDESLKFISKSSIEGLDIIRHSSAHLMAAAIEKIYPETKFAIGPSIENGFYYDIDLDKKISEFDFGKIEEEMKKLVDADVKFIKKIISKKQALTLFKKNPYKIDIIQNLPSDAEISIYEIGNYIDLCCGPHVPSTRYLKYFKLTKVSGAY